VLASAELPEIIRCFRRNVRKKLHLYSPSRLSAYCNVCRGKSIASVLL
jgi:hypothetical protein